MNPVKKFPILDIAHKDFYAFKNLFLSHRLDVNFLTG